MNNLLIKMIAAGVLMLAIFGQATAADVMLKPYVLAAGQGADMATALKNVKSKLKANGFELIGEYSPYSGVSVIAVTNGTLKSAAAKTDFGVFGAAQRVTITKGKKAVQVAYTNPLYMANAYRMKADLAPVAAQLKKALGKNRDYGSEEGLTAEDLNDYRYKWLMPYFDDRLKLVEYSSHEAAIKGVETALAAGKGGLKKVYRVDLNGKQASVFGVAIKGNTDSTECAGDKYIMDYIDFRETKSSGHLPYEVVVKGKVAYGLPAEFRIAISFPDLSMMGSNSFASIMCAPTAIEEALTLGAGGKIEEEEL